MQFIDAIRMSIVAALGLAVCASCRVAPPSPSGHPSPQARSAPAAADDPSVRSAGQLTKEEKEWEAVTKLRAFAVAEATMLAEMGQYATLEELTRQGALKEDFAAGETAGYKFSFTVSDDKQGFSATATPARYGETTVRSFFIGPDLMMRGADRGGAPATANDPPIHVEIYHPDAPMIPD